MAIKVEYYIYMDLIRVVYIFATILSVRSSVPISLSTLNSSGVHVLGRLALSLHRVDITSHLIIVDYLLQISLFTIFDYNKLT
jgi:hypothetical protein